MYGFGLRVQIFEVSAQGVLRLQDVGFTMGQGFGPFTLER